MDIEVPECIYKNNRELFFPVLYCGGDGCAAITLYLIMQSTGGRTIRAVSTVSILIFAILAVCGTAGAEEQMNENPGKNRLAGEKSPYLLQHADNPVDWYPWGDEAFAAAKEQDKPIFLSIGYSSCHWCHVMEHESFEDEAVARLLNEHFISIKVDREERPDIDNIYMKVTQAMTGSGGWPMTVFMSPDGKPFFAGTYFPKQSKYGRPGMIELVPHIASLWKNDRERLQGIGDNATKALESSSFAGDERSLDDKLIATAYSRLEASYDEVHGGFGGSPKFPTPHQLSMLLRYWDRTGDTRALEIVGTTLRKMYGGGIYDHLGKGFHRYSTDPMWLVPHFEKMLYDQAMLAIAYLETYQATGNRFYGEVAEEIFEYVLRDLTSPEGGFYSAEDADSEGEEGTFYVWTKDEVTGALGETDSKVFCARYGVTGGGNFEGKNVLHISSDTDADPASLDIMKEKLLAIRSERPRPMLDDKILADWNGLMIAALARGARVTGKNEYAAAAEKAAGFILGGMRTSEGRLLHRYRDGESAIPGYLDDYAFMTWGMIELYEATFDAKWLSAALDLADGMLELFGDSEEGKGGLFFTGSDAEKLIVRTKEIYDGAVPSGNSVAALCLLRLGRMTGRTDLESAGDALMEEFSGQLAGSPTAYTQMLIALDFALGPGREYVVAGDYDAEETESIRKLLAVRFMPRSVTLFRPSGEGAAGIIGLAPMLEGMTAVDGNPTVYICEDFKCAAPAVGEDELRRRLAEMEGKDD